MMPLAEWIQKYPGVARLLQQDEDRLEGASCEKGSLGADEESSVQHFQDHAAWTARVAFLRELYHRRHGVGLFFWAYCAPDVFARVLWGRPPDLHYDPASPYPAAPFFFQDWLRVMPWNGCLPGTWCLHWTTDMDQPQVITTDARTATHPVVRPVRSWNDGTVGGAMDLVGEGSALAEESIESLCRVVRPAPICPCGAYMMQWIEQQE